jgi:hypothetical protein
MSETTELPMNQRNPSIGFVATLMAAAALVYVFSFGPSVWLVDRELLPSWSKPVVSIVYDPVFWTSMAGPRPIRKLITWYAELGAKRRAERVYDLPSDVD